MVQNAAVQALREADELKQKLFEGTEDAVVSTNKTLLLTQLQKIYQKVLLIDLDYALDKKVEQDLWNIGFKNQIESLQKSTKDKKNSHRAESQMLLNWCIQAATGFYLSLLNQICSLFKLNLPFRCNIPMVMECQELWKLTARPPQASSCWYICQYCLVHLGDLARYTRQPKMASSFYKQALSVSPSNGQPYNQLGLLSATRGDKLGAAYYHARGLAVGGPFPPALNNLTRILAQANAITENCPTTDDEALNFSNIDSSSYTRLNPSIFLAQYMSIHHHILANDDFEKASKIAKGMSSNLTALVATQQFQSDTLLQISCLSMYSVFSLTDAHTLSMEATSMTEEEKCWLNLAINILAGTMEALLLPVHTMSQNQLRTYSGLSATKSLLEWLKLHPEMLKHSAFVSRPQLWPGLCVLLSGLQDSIKEFNGEMYSTVPLPEEEELRGFLPIDKALQNLKFNNTVSSEIYGNSIVEIKDILPSSDTEEISEKDIISKYKITGVSLSEQENLKKDTNFIECLRSYRLVEIGKWLVSFQKENGVEYISMSCESDSFIFTPIQSTVESDPDLVKTIKELSILREKKLSECHDAENQEDTSDNEFKPTVALDKCQSVGGMNTSGNVTSSVTSGDTSPHVENKTPPPPVIMSEADFREKVREKKAGILKPQGSLERARLEKAALNRASARGSPADLADSHDNQDTGSSCSTVSQDGNICSDVGSLLEPSVPKEKGKKTRTNVALQAILKKQEESNKQVKFLTPVTTPDSISEPTPQLSPQISKDFEKKIIQPKIIKSLFSLPTDRKTGGILSLKDKSGVYPHLQKIEDPLDAKVENLESANDPKRNPDASSEAIVNSIKSIAKKDVGNPVQNIGDRNISFGHSAWGGIGAHTQAEEKPLNARLQAQSNFSYFSPPGTTQNMSITLPVVNPKEIDVRSAALHKQKNIYGTGGYMSPDTCVADPSMSPYNYWGDQTNVQQNFHKNFSKGSPRSNTKWSNANDYPLMRGADIQYQPPGAVHQGPSGAFSSPAPQNTWWKLPTQEQNYDVQHFYPAHNLSHYSAPNYQQPNSPNFAQPHANASSFQNDYSKMPYNSAVMPDSSHFSSNPGYPSNTLIYQSSPYAPHPNYNPGMFPQFTNRFNPPSHPQMKPGTEYNMNSYGYDKQASDVSSLDVRAPAYHQSSSVKPGQYNVGCEDKTGSSMSAEMAGNMEAINKPQGSGQSLNTYSLFSGSSSSNENVWPAAPLSNQNMQPSLWSGPGPSPLERLLEQQKQFRFPPNE